ncbi:MAG: hypothetical protein HKN29_11555 [Rhodothermales bacterium]|nr:hypothetical protein [Rhodothermales bacterium]
MRRVITLLGLMVVFGQGNVGSAQVAQETVVADEPIRSPRAALLRASLVPGWGQIYNREYLKLPLLYGAMGALAVTAIQANQDYVLYRNAFQYKAFDEITAEGETNPAAQYQSDYETLAAEFGPISSSPLEAQRDNFRRNRDLSIIGVAAIWGLGVLDAYVSAHLSSFDVGEDLTLKVDPGVHPLPRAGGVGTSLTLTISW